MAEEFDPDAFDERRAREDKAEEEAAAFSRVMFRIDIESEPELLAALQSETGLSKGGLELMNRIRFDLREHLHPENPDEAVVAFMYAASSLAAEACGRVHGLDREAIGERTQRLWAALKKTDW